MLKKLFLFSVLIQLLVFTPSCKKEEPTVSDFDYTRIGTEPPCLVNFTNKSKNATSYQWDFGDGFSSIAANPSHTYQSSGSFTISLNATGPSGTVSSSKDVYIYEKSTQLPSPNFAITGNGGTAPCVVSFVNTSTNATSYSWNFGDGGSSFSTNPSHTYSIGGDFTVTLTATNSAGSKSVSETVSIVDKQMTQVKIMKVTLVGMPFTNSSGVSWDPFDGPDVYFNLTDKFSNILSDGSGAKKSDITSSSLPTAWTYSNGYLISDLNEGIFVDLWDYDTLDSDDYITYIGFLMSDYTTYPSSVTKTQNGITLKFDLVWQ
jgi:PKD repeat protein